MSDHYILDENNEAIPVDLMTWAKWFEENRTDKRRVKKDVLPNGMIVSTVFLGLDHSWYEGPPILFETMVFRSKEDFREIDMDRCNTYVQALAMHQRIMKKHLRAYKSAIKATSEEVPNDGLAPDKLKRSR